MADQFYGITDTGKERKNNEDTFIAQQSTNGRFIIACVIDGVGGYSGGEVAAALAREAILQRLERPAGEVIPILVDCFNLANQKILTDKKEVKQHDSMACVATLALVDIERNQFHYVHVGDTRLYLLRDHSLVKISQDQSFVGFLEDSGRLTEEAAMTHPKRNEINKALGFEHTLTNDDDYYETGQSPFLPGDILLLCSDGLTDMVGKAEMAKIISQDETLENKCNLLVAAANQHGGKDNITAVLVQNSKQAAKYDATKPATNQKKNEPDSVPVAASNQPHGIAKPEPSTPVKGKSAAIPILSILLVLAVGIVIWQYLKSQKPAEVPAKSVAVVVPVVKPLSLQQIKLQDTIDHLKGNLLVLTDSVFKTPILISRAIEIKRDTLFIKAKGHIEFKSDSGYTGVAFNISLQCKLVMLDSLMFTNFKTGIAGNSKALLIKNVRFVNCATPIQNIINIPVNKYISGTVTAFKADSLPVIHKRK